MLGDIERQLKYEQDSDADAVAAKLQAVLTEAANGSADTTKAKALISRMFGEVRDYIEAQKSVQTRGLGGKYKNWLRALPSDVAAVIAMRECVNLCLNNYYDQILKTQEALGAAVTGALISILEPLSNCAESGYSTLAPSSNSVSGRDVTLAAVAVAAAAALLL